MIQVFRNFLKSLMKLQSNIKNIKVLMTEKCKFLNVAPPVMNNIFYKQENYYSLRNPRSLVSKQKFTATYGIDIISFRGLQIWQYLPQDIINSDSLKPSKSNIKRFGTLTCLCKLCKSFVPCKGYID